MAFFISGFLLKRIFSLILLFLEGAGAAVPQWFGDKIKPEEEADEARQECREGIAGGESVVGDGKSGEHEEGEGAETSSHHHGQFDGHEFLGLGAKE
jgi:hypothetical protein